jgi:hypothetical protein
MPINTREIAKTVLLKLWGEQLCKLWGEKHIESAIDAMVEYGNELRRPHRPHNVDFFNNADIVDILTIFTMYWADYSHLPSFKKDELIIRKWWDEVYNNQASRGYVWNRAELEQKNPELPKDGEFWYNRFIEIERRYNDQQKELNDLRTKHHALMNITGIKGIQ